MASYVYGNAARKRNTVHAPQQPDYQQTSKESRAKRKHHNTLRMNRGYVMFLAAAAVITLFVCVQYLQLHAEVSSRSSDIFQMQSSLKTQKEINTTRYNSIMEQVDLDAIRDKAMNELGMVYTEEGQIIKYKNPDTNAVTQHTAIPKSGIVAE